MTPAPQGVGEPLGPCRAARNPARAEILSFTDEGKGFTMRRVFFSLLAMSLVGLAVGCSHTHGVCDCENDDPCANRAPWVHGGGGPVTFQSPEGKEVLPNPTQKK